MTRPGLLQPPAGSRCVLGSGALGRPAAAGTGSGARSISGTSAGATSSARVSVRAGAGVSLRGLGATARLARAGLGARDTSAFGAGLGLSIRSLALTNSSFGAAIPASWTSPPPTVARSAFRSSLSAGDSLEGEHAAKVASASMTEVERM